MALQKQQQSLAVIKCNFMTSESKIEKCGSKLFRREYKDGLYGLVGELTEGMNLNVKVKSGLKDRTDRLIGHTVSLRVTEEMLDSIDDYVTEESRGGLEITVDLGGDHVRSGILTSKGVETLSLTIYAAEILEVNEVKISKVGTVLEDDLFEKHLDLKGQRENEARESAMSMNRQNQAAMASADVAEQELTIAVRN